MRRWLTCIVLLLGMATAAHAAAPTASSSKQELCLKDERCRIHYANARDLSKSGKLVEAIAEYEAAYSEIQIPVFLYNLGRLHHRMGNTKDASAFYRRFLDAALDDDREQQTRAKEYLKELEPPIVPSAMPLASPTIASIVDSKPVYKKWWFWTILGTVAVGTAVGVGVGVGLKDRVTVPEGVMHYAPSF